MYLFAPFLCPVLFSPINQVVQVKVRSDGKANISSSLETL